MKNQSTTNWDRSSLRFPENVLRYFSFLQAFGYRCVQSNESFVRFDSPPLFINVFHGRSSFEIGVELGRIEDYDRADYYPYSLSELLGVAQYPKAEEYRDYATSTRNGVNTGVELVSNLFRDHVVPILNKPGLFELLEVQRKARNENYYKNMELRYLKRDLDKAWAAKDYPKVVELLTPVRMDLDQVQIKKLEYAQTHLKDIDLNRG